jgi:hypothetical protein
MNASVIYFKGNTNFAQEMEQNKEYRINNGDCLSLLPSMYTYRLEQDTSAVATPGNQHKNGSNYFTAVDPELTQNLYAHDEKTVQFQSPKRKNEVEEEALTKRQKKEDNAMMSPGKSEAIPEPTTPKSSPSTVPNTPVKDQIGTDEEKAMKAIVRFYRNDN